jgi:uncharacterized protein YndB with AHSA1/START domain
MHAVRLERVIPASPARVYRAWLDPEVIRQWLAPGRLEVSRAEVDERAGGRYRIWQQDSGVDGGGFECEILELVPDEKLVFSWGFAGPERTLGPVYDSMLTVTLEEAPDGATKLTLVHQRLEALHAAMPEVAELVETGWKLVLDKLASNVAEPA